MERQWRQPVGCSRSSTVRSIGAALDGASRRYQHTYLQSNTTDDARPRSMTDKYFAGARRRKFWTFQNFRTATADIGAQWRLAAFTHGCVCALWRSTAFIDGFGTAAERWEKPPMCNSGIPFNTLRPRQDGRHFSDDTFKRIFLNENVGISIKIALKFVHKGPINNIPALVQMMAWSRPGDKSLSEPKGD